MGGTVNARMLLDLVKWTIKTADCKLTFGYRKETNVLFIIKKYMKAFFENEIKFRGHKYPKISVSDVTAMYKMVKQHTNPDQFLSSVLFSTDDHKIPCFANRRNDKELVEKMGLFYTPVGHFDETIYTDSLAILEYERLVQNVFSTKFATSVSTQKHKALVLGKKVIDKDDGDFQYKRDIKELPIFETSEKPELKSVFDVFHKHLGDYEEDYKDITLSQQREEALFNLQEDQRQHEAAYGEQQGTHRYDPTEELLMQDPIAQLLYKKGKVNLYDNFPEVKQRNEVASNDPQEEGVKKSLNVQDHVFSAQGNNKKGRIDRSFLDDDEEKQQTFKTPIIKANSCTDIQGSNEEQEKKSEDSKISNFKIGHKWDNKRGVHESPHERMMEFTQKHSKKEKVKRNPRFVVTDPSKSSYKVGQKITEADITQIHALIEFYNEQKDNAKAPKYNLETAKRKRDRMVKDIQRKIEPKSKNSKIQKFG